MINKYETNVGPFTEKTGEYLAITSGYTENSSASELTYGVEEGLRDEISVYEEKENIIK